MNTYDHLVHFRQKKVKDAENMTENIPLQSILEIAFEYVAQEGFVSIVSEESGGVVSTSTRVRNWFQDNKSTVLKTLTTESEKNALDCIKWVQGWDIEIVENEVDTFSNRIYKIFSDGYNILKEIPMICGVIPDFLYKGKELRNCIDSEFVGKMDEPFEGFVKLMKYDYNQEQEYSTFKCRDKEGNIIFFWSNPSIGDNHDLSIGDCFTFKGVVVQMHQSEYDNGLKSTRVNRVEIIKNYGKPK